MPETNALQERLLSVPNFKNSKEKKEYLEAMFRGEVPFALANGGMGIDFSGEEFVISMMRSRAIGVLSASAPGYEFIRPGLKIKGKTIDEYSAKERKEIFYQWNKIALDKMVANVRQQCKYGILGANCMKILDHYDSTREDMIANGEIDIGFVGAGLATDLPERMSQGDAQHMYYVPIVSSVLAARGILRSAKQCKGRFPDAFYVELPPEAGGHIASRRNENDPKEFDPQTIKEGIEKMLKKYGVTKHVPIILAGGIAFRDQIEHAHSLGYEVAMATPLLLSQESGMPNKTLVEKYLNPDISVIDDRKSSTGYESRRLDTPYTERTPESIRRNIRRCVQCVMPSCKYMEGANDLKTDDNYCIANDLSRARFGMDNGILFVGKGIYELRASGIYEFNGKPYIPIIREILHALMNMNAPKISDMA